MHSSSASGVSLPRTPNTSCISSSSSSSSSRSSYPSSPDSASVTSLPISPHTHSPSLHRPSVSPSSAIIPFSWEEKPGVLKKEMMVQSGLEEERGSTMTSVPSLRRGDVTEVDAPTSNIASDADLQGTTHGRPKTPCTGEDLPPRMHLPPCLSYTEPVAEGRPKFTTMSHPHRRQHSHSGGGASAAAAAGSKVMSSLSLPKRRHHRSTPSLEDDPFWLAMVACTSDADKGAPTRRKACPKAFVGRQVSRTDSWLARRAQAKIHLDQCMTHQEHGTITRKGQVKALDEIGSDNEQESRSNTVNIPSSKVHHMHTDDLQHPGVLGSATHSRLPSKAFKALSMARTELHGRCKALLQHHKQGPPIVDISCTGSGRQIPKPTSGGSASKHKLPDLLGCKTNRRP